MTEELTGNYNNNNNKYELADNVVENNNKGNKKVYETITVVPYQVESSKNVPAAGSVSEGKTDINDARTLGYDTNG